MGKTKIRFSIAGFPSCDSKLAAPIQEKIEMKIKYKMNSFIFYKNFPRMETQQSKSRSNKVYFVTSLTYNPETLYKAVLRSEGKRAVCTNAY